MSELKYKGFYMPEVEDVTRSFDDTCLKDLPLAMEYLRSAAARGNEYAAGLINQKELFDKQSISLCISRLFKYLCGVLQEKAEAEFSAKIMRTDKKLRRRIAEKKQAQGLKLE